MIAKILLLLALCATAQAQQTQQTLQKTVDCAPTQLVLKNLQRKYGEQPLWGAQVQHTTVAVFVNQQTKTWTLIQFDENLACVLDTGTHYVLVTGPGV